ncbi:diguanylate cyclase [Alginatibacterium sediminis]|uniref:Diguanylate cyclase n=1 Tax=Alginatibacterium sediminis TaxID=2164068 RepID=A0A420EDB0_9ALTE|nr:GGDEF domain-containing protein [Alginatibacterium sediminis]RKF18658.1 diguanylate cyclase [Alginatibacterium sediminis]
MRFKLSIKLTLVFAMIAIAVSVITAYQAFSASRDLILEDAQQQLQDTNRVLATRIENAITRSEDLALFLAANRHMREYHNPGDRKERYDSISEMFEQMLTFNANFMSITFIDSRNYNRELVSFVRQEDSLRRIPLIELKELSHFPYVFKTLRLKPGEAYRSPITMGKIRIVSSDSWYSFPSFRTSSPIYNGDELVGIVAIDVDLGVTFNSLKQDLPSGTELYLANATGDYLIHPEPNKQFGFLLGDRYQLQRDFEALSGLIQQPREISFTSNHRFDLIDLTAGAFMPIDYNSAGERNVLYLGLVGELRSLRTMTSHLINELLVNLAFVTFIGIAVAMLLGRFVSRPLILLLSAMRSLKAGHTHDFKQLSINRTDEIGALSRSFKKMAQQIDNQMLELETQRQSFEHLSRHDPLTGLPNRSYFLSILNHDIANSKRLRSQLAVAFIDLDDFKPINDLYGHDSGDDLLKTVADELRASLREVDTVARFAGDEFLLILNGISDQEAVASVIAHLLERLAQKHTIVEHQLPIYASVGISLYPGDSESANDLIKQADQAMYKAKQAGRNRYQFFSDSPNE